MNRSLSLAVGLGVLASAGVLEIRAGQASTAVPDDVKNVFVSRCAVCHRGKTPPAGLVLEAERLPASIVGVASSENNGLQLVEPGLPEASYLVRKIKGAESIGGKRMPPPPQEPLGAAEIQRLEEWIRDLPPRTAATGAGFAGGNPRSPEKPAFWGARVVSLRTTKMIAKGDFLFLVAHRFVPPTSEGADELWGLDGPAMVFLGLGYGISDRIGLSAGRTRLDKE